MAARDAAAKQARASGDKELAAAIKALRRPSVAAWYVNLAARGSLVSLREWLALGASLREAQSALDMARVRSLGAGRAALEDRVIRDLTAHLATLGVTATAPALEEVRTTLRAALADANAAERVAAGRLDRALTYGGFGEVDVSAALAAMAASRPEPDTGPEPAAEPDAEPETEPEPQEEPEPEPPPAPERGPDPALVAAAEAARERLDRATAALAVAQRELREAQARLADAEGEVIASGKAHREAQAALGG